MSPNLSLFQAEQAWLPQLLCTACAPTSDQLSSPLAQISVLPVAEASKLVAVFPICSLPLIDGHATVDTAWNAMGLPCWQGTLLACLQIAVSQDPHTGGPLCFCRATLQTATLCKRFFGVPGAGEIRTKCLPVVFNCICCPVFILISPFPLCVCSGPRNTKILRHRTNIQSSLGSW